MTNLDQLTPELLRLILQSVNRRDLITCALVCRSLSSAVISLLWRTCTITGPTKCQKVLDAMTTSPNQLGRHIHHLAFQSVRLSDQNLTHWMAAMSGDVQQQQQQQLLQLASLTVTSPSILSSQAFEQLSPRWPALTSLSLTSTKINNQGMEAIGQHCPLLNNLFLKRCRQISPPGFLESLVHCPLARMELSYCIDGQYLRKTNGQLFMKVYRNALEPRLITGLLSMGPVGDDMAILWPDLTSLIVTGSSGIHDEQTIIPFIQSHPFLTTLELRGSNLSDATLDAIVEHLPDVEKVMISHNHRVTARAIRRMVWHCIDLVNLSFARCNVTTAQFPELIPQRRQPLTRQQQQRQQQQDDDDLPPGWYRVRLTGGRPGRPGRRPNINTANFSGLGRWKIASIRRHSEPSGERKQEMD